MKKIKKQDDMSNLRLAPGSTYDSASLGAELAETIAQRLITLQGELNLSAFARKCGIRDSLMRKYLAGSIPGADKLAKIAIANHVSLDWLAAERGPMRYDEKLQAAHEDRVAGTYLGDETATRRADEYARHAIEAKIKLPTETIRRLAIEEGVDLPEGWHPLLVELLALGHITEIGARRVLQRLKGEK